MQMHAYKLIIFIMAGSLIGILLARVIGEQVSYIAWASLLLVFVSAAFRRIFWLAVLGFAVCIGLARSQPVLQDHQVLQAHHDQKVGILATVTTDPVYHRSGQFEFYADQLKINQRPLTATLKVRSYVNQVQRGDRIYIEGVLRDGFAFWQGSMYYAKTEVINSDTSLIHGFRARFIANVYSAMPDPEASLGLGFLIGIRSLLPDDLVEQLSITGLTHIVAVSGYNLTILVSISRRILARFSRFQSLFFSSLLLIGFITITGLSPSILRATVVSGMSLLAWYYGKRVNPWLLLLYSSSISAFLRPAYVWYDIGWYLSLLAFMGVLVLAPAVQRRLYKEKQPKLVAQIMLETTSAQIMTMPIIMYVFGQVSLIALLANLVVLPFIPLTMLLTFLVGLAYFVWFKLAWLFMWPAYVVLSFITSSIGFMAQIDWALIDVSLSRMQITVAYGFLGVWLVWMYRRFSSGSFDIIPLDSNKPNELTEQEEMHGRTLKMGKD